jgi:hypothetical protein
VLYNFDTDNRKLANAALVLYALYRSRGLNSPINGLETWNRVESYCVGACKKSRTTSEFVTKFKELGKIGAIKPRYLADPTKDSEMTALPDGTLVESDCVKNYRIGLLEDNEIRKTIEKEYPLVVILVRDRIQREKYIVEEEEEDFYNEED